jgi:glycosyltransferase involved in cell wall biosynthesis
VNDITVLPSTSRDAASPVVFIGPTFPFKGGIAKYSTVFFWELSARFPAEMHTYRTMYPGWIFPGKTVLDPSASRFGVEGAVRDLSFVQPLTFLRLGRKLRRRAPACVIMTWWTAAWIPHMWLFLMGLGDKVPLVFWCHNVFDHARSRLMSLASRCVLRRVRRFVVHSEAERRTLAEAVPNGDIRVSALPLLNVFRPVTAGARAGAAATDPAGPRKLLCFGFMRPYKGLEDLVSALPSILKEEEVELVIAGESWNGAAEKLRRQACELGVDDHVDVRDGYVPNEDIESLFGATDLVVMPYCGATGSGVAGLAIEFEKPLVVADVGSLPEAVVDGKTGWVAGAGDRSSLAATIIKALRNPVQAEALRARHLELADGWRRLLDAFTDLIPGAANGPGCSDD